MTLIVCLQGTDGIVIASDSRGTFGDPRGVTAQNDTIKKAYLVDNVGLLTAGGQQGNMVIDELERVVKKKKIKGVTKVMEELRKTAKSKFDEWFSDFPFLPEPGKNVLFSRPQLHFIVAGYDDVSTARIFSMLSTFDFAPNLHDFGFALVGVAQYALYLLNRLYSPTLTAERLTPLAAYVVTETATQDGKVGGPVQIAVVRPDTAHMLKRQDIDKVIAENENRGNMFREEFQEK